MLRTPARRVCFLFLALVACGAWLRAGPWPEIESDLPPHPQLQTGTLPNGLRYLVLPNAEPRDRISLRLVVAVGAVHENASELGMAHFLEHMAFRGTRTHPAGSLTPTLQRLGIGLGPDNSAFTHLDRTSYHLDLPSASDATLREGLRVFREYAEEISFDGAAIERERGVILSEHITRDTPQTRAQTANLRLLWPDSLHARAPIGGTLATTKAFKREQFVAFYDAWYRPERMAVIVVGNVEAAAAAKAIEDELGRLAARGPARPEPAGLDDIVASRADVEVFKDPGLGGFSIALQRPAVRPATKTRSDRIQRLREQLAMAMLYQRLFALSLETDATLMTPQVGIIPGIGRWDIVSMSATGKLDQWRLVAARLEQEHRRAIQFGFTASELARARVNFATAQDNAIRSFATWPSSWLANQLELYLVAGEVLATPEAVRSDFGEALAATTEVDCLLALRRLWTDKAPHVYAVAHPSVSVPPQDLSEVLNKSRDSEVAAYTDAAGSAKFAYEDFGPAGKLLHTEHVADLDARLSHFENGVRFNHKETSFEANSILINLRVGEGKLTQREDRPGLDYLANIAVPEGGLGKHPPHEMSALLSGRSFDIRFVAGTDACWFTARCAKDDLKFTLQVIAAYLTDPAFRPDAQRQAHAAFSGMYSNLAASPGGSIQLYAQRDLAGGDRRFGLPAVDELYARTVDEVKAWVAPQLASGAIEMSVVGDVGWEQARTAVAETIGALPERSSRRVGSTAAVHPPKTPPKPKVIAVSGNGAHTAIAWCWPVLQIADVREGRRLHMLAEVLNERFRQRLRDELGAAYVTAAHFVETPGFPRLNHFVFQTEVVSQHLAAALRILDRETKALSRDGISADEFVRVREPYLRHRIDEMRQNGYWGGTLLSDVQQYPEQLAASRNRISDTQAITREELSALAKRHLAPAKSFKYQTVPIIRTLVAPGTQPAQTAR